MVSQTVSANGQRVWNRQPDGGSIGFGGSPVIGGSSMRRAGSIDGPRREQRPRIGVLRPLEYRVGRAELDHAAEIHHEDALADKSNDIQIVADKDESQIELPLQRTQQIEHLRLDRFIERRNRLVEDHHARPGRQRAGNIDPLLLPAGKLVRIARAKQVRIEAHPAEDVARNAARFRLFLALDKRAERHRVADRHARVQR